MNLNIKNAEKVLRRDSTPMERKFWNAVRNRKFLNLKFVRQYPITYQCDGRDRFFVVDFYCATHKIAIEIDGPIHDAQADADKARAEIISFTGIEIVRFTNRDIAHDFQKSLFKLKNIIQKRAQDLDCNMDPT